MFVYSDMVERFSSEIKFLQAKYMLTLGVELSFVEASFIYACNLSEKDEVVVFHLDDVMVEVTRLKEVAEKIVPNKKYVFNEPSTGYVYCNVDSVIPEYIVSSEMIILSFDKPCKKVNLGVQENVKSVTLHGETGELESFSCNTDFEENCIKVSNTSLVSNNAFSNKYFKKVEFDCPDSVVILSKCFCNCNIDSLVMNLPCKYISKCVELWSCFINTSITDYDRISFIKDEAYGHFLNRLEYFKCTN